LILFYLHLFYIVNLFFGDKNIPIITINDNKKNQIESLISFFTIIVLISLLLIKNIFYYYHANSEISTIFYLGFFFLFVFIWFTLISLNIKKNIIFNKIQNNLNIPILLMFLVSLITLLSIFFNSSNQEMIIYQVKVLIYASIHLSLGYFILRALDEEYVKFIVCFSFFMFVLFVLLSLIIKWNDYWPQPLKNIHVGDAFSLLGIVFISILKNKYLKIISLTIIILGLFFIQSRASFFSFGVIGLLIMFKELGLKRTLLMGTLLLCIICITILFFYDTNLVNRMLIDVFSGNDSSMSERNQLLFQGLKSIKEHWFLGDFGGQYTNSSVSGHYIHNILSLWRQYGILFFILFFFFYYHTLCRLSTIWYFKKNFKIDVTFYLSLFTGIEFLLFRSYGTTHYWLGLGLMYSYLYSHHHND